MHEALFRVQRNVVTSSRAAVTHLSVQIKGSNKMHRTVCVLPLEQSVLLCSVPLGKCKRSKLQSLPSARRQLSRRDFPVAIYNVIDEREK